MASHPSPAKPAPLRPATRPRVAGTNSICGDAVLPVPVSVAVCGEPVALSATLSEALKLVAEAGVKLTEMLQLVPAASELPQALM